jgi:hypothetical protein
MNKIKHLLLGEKVSYDSLNAKQQEAYNFQKVSAIFAEYGYLVIKLSDDWNGADFIALEFSKENYLKVQLKGRLGFFKKYINKNIFICFYEHETNSYYLYPHDELYKTMMEKYGDSDSWKNKGEYHFPKLSEENKKILEKYKLI